MAAFSRLDLFGDGRADLGEGPCWHAARGTLWWIDITGQRVFESRLDGGAPQEWAVGQKVGCVAPERSGGLITALHDGIYRLDPDTGVTTLFARAPGHDPAGFRFNDGKVDPQGRLIFCEIDKRAIVRRALDGTETILADSCDGQKLTAPNDLWLAPNGDIYFTLPKLRPAKAKKDAIPENVLNGTLCRISADGKSVTNVGKAVGVEAPNGVVGTSDGKQIWWTDGAVCKTAKINADGTLSDPKVAAKVGSDGLAVDAR
jgi:sugar lactone lactonase YvrE